MKQNTSSQRIVAEIRARIRSGALRPGDRVPSARQIVKEHGVAIATAQKVLEELRRAGLVRAKPGIGTIVRGERGADLSRERIALAAIALADDEGLAALSMRGVANELGVPTMSLYRHVASKDELLLLMMDAVIHEDPVPDIVATEPPRARLERIARLAWKGYRRHPWLAHAVSITRPQPLPSGMRQTEYVLRALADLGLDSESTLRTGVALMAFVRGIAIGLEAERHAEQDSGMTNDEWMDAQQATFEPLLDRFPTLARVSREADGVDMGLDALFEHGLACFLDGIEARWGRRPRD